MIIENVVWVIISVVNLRFRFSWWKLVFIVRLVMMLGRVIGSIMVKLRVSRLKNWNRCRVKVRSELSTSAMIVVVSVRCTDMVSASRVFWLWVVCDY